MIVLDSSTKLQAVLAGAITSSQLPINVSWNDSTSTGPSPGITRSTTNSTTAVDILAAPASSVQRFVKQISVYNGDTASATITIRTNNGGTTRQIFKCALAVGYTLSYDDSKGWRVYDTLGNPRANTSPSGRLLNVTSTATNQTAINITSYIFNPRPQTTAIALQMIGGNGATGGIATGTASDGAAIGGSSSGAYLYAWITSGIASAAWASGNATGGANTGASGGDGTASTITFGATTYTAAAGKGSIGTTAQARTTTQAFWIGAAGAASTNGLINGTGMPGIAGMVQTIATTGNYAGGGGGFAGPNSAIRTTNGSGSSGSPNAGGGSFGPVEVAVTTNNTGSNGVGGYALFFEYS